MRSIGRAGYGLRITCMKLPCADTLATLMTVPVCGLFTLIQPAW